jgi:hypothetical protein
MSQTAAPDGATEATIADQLGDLSISKPSPPSLLPPSPASGPTADDDAPLGSASQRVFSFLDSAGEIRNMIYRNIVSVDQNPILIENHRNARNVDTSIMQVDRRTRNEAYAILRDENIWVTLVVNSPSDETNSALLKALRSCMRQFRPAPADFPEFHRGRSIVIEVGDGCGARNTRPLPDVYKSKRCLLAFDRQSFDFVCLKLWMYSKLCRFMTVIWNVESLPTKNPRLLEQVTTSLLKVQGYQGAVCIGFPDENVACRIEQKIKHRTRSLVDVFTLYARTDSEGGAAFSAGRYGDAVHIYRCMCHWGEISAIVPESLVPGPLAMGYVAARIEADMMIKLSKSILSVLRGIQDISLDRLFKLESSLFDEAITWADRALGCRTITNSQRKRGHQYRGMAFQLRAQYHSEKGKTREARLDNEEAALDLYHTSLLVDTPAHPEDVPIEDLLKKVERSLGCTRADTTARAETMMLVEQTGIIWAGDIRVFAGWGLSVASYMEKMREWSQLPTVDEALDKFRRNQGTEGLLA